MNIFKQIYKSVFVLLVFVLVLVLGSLSLIPKNTQAQPYVAAYIDGSWYCTVVDPIHPEFNMDWYQGDGVTIDYFKIYRNGTYMDTVLSPWDSYTDHSPTPNTSYAYEVRPFDAWDTQKATLSISAEIGSCAQPDEPGDPVWIVNTSANSGGIISPTSYTSVTDGSTKSFTVTPSSGYKGSVSGCGGTALSNFTSATTYVTGAIIANCTVTATFTAAPVNTTLYVNSSGASSAPIVATAGNGTSGSTPYSTVVSND